MKKMGILLVGSLLSAVSFAGDLDGMKFCRAIQGQPKMERSHYVAFENGIMEDNADTFFGNPPSRESYRLEDSNVIAKYSDGKEYHAYQLNQDRTQLKNEVGSVLKLVTDASNDCTILRELE